MPAFTENPLVRILSSSIAWPCVADVRGEETRGVGRPRSFWKLPQSPYPLSAGSFPSGAPPRRPQSLKLKAAGVMSVYAGLHRTR